MSARDRILTRVRAAVSSRPREEPPGPFGAWRPEPPPVDPVEGFVWLFEQAGGEVVRVADLSEAAGWLARQAAARGGVAAGATVPSAVVAGLATAPPEDAGVGVSLATCAVAETGSLVLDARDGRRPQLLPPVHVVLVRERDVHPTLGGALRALSADLPSAIGLHSGPSKSADIGQVLVRGVHGPGRVVALLLGEGS
ncbi:MAG TPA: LUD domain-containing protein [Longimicrobiales bacterium]|nr:LUD domain-containing protein [Longimicrobiales bacterium]